MNMLINLDDKTEAADDECVRVKLVDEVCFYTIEDLMPLLGWSRVVVQKLFNDPKFPSTDYGKQKVVEKHALIKYFSVRHEKRYDNFWRG